MRNVKLQRKTTAMYVRLLLSLLLTLALLCGCVNGENNILTKTPTSDTADNSIAETEVVSQQAETSQNTTTSSDKKPSSSKDTKSKQTSQNTNTSSKKKPSSQNTSTSSNQSKLSSSKNSSILQKPETSSENTVSQNIPLETVVNKFGNTAGNLHNGGCAAIQGDWIYYSSSSGLYKINVDGTKRKRLFDSYAGDINVCGDWIYFCSSGSAPITTYYKMKTDGTECQLFVEKAAKLIIANEWAYYIDAENRSRLYKMRLDKSEKTLVLEHESINHNLNITEDKIFWGNNINVYMADLDGGNIICYENVGSQGMIIYNGLKYTNAKLYISNYDGSNQMALLEKGGGAMNITIADDWIYFTYSSDNDCIYKIKTDGTGMQKLNNTPSSGICVAGDWIFYSSMKVYEINEDEWYAESDKHCKIRIDGTENKILG